MDAVIMAVIVVGTLGSFGCVMYLIHAEGKDAQADKEAK